MDDSDADAYTSLHLSHLPGPAGPLRGTVPLSAIQFDATLGIVPLENLPNEAVASSSRRHMHGDAWEHVSNLIWRYYSMVCLRYSFFHVYTYI